MDDKKIANNLHAYLMPARPLFCSSSYKTLHEQAFDLWFNNTKTALLEEKNFDVASTFNGDVFYEYDEFALITHHQKPIGIFMFCWHDLSHSSAALLSIISHRFPKHLIDELQKKQQSTIMIMGNLAVDPAWRRHHVGFGIADILMSFATRRFLSSNANALLTTTRNNRSTNELCYRQGGNKFADNEKVFGVSSDVVLFYRHDVKPHPLQHIHSMAQTLWSSKINAWNEYRIEPNCTYEI